ncbi:hypothetical protein LKACC16343_02205 [Companilactobacillus bobalius]|uniref:Uncharacterized protein n=1 Tax=Companilactobacillus bobalius TaxID=2801451 RepID=A0A202F7X3_9LACO|nr:hypothetical protein LKACC16343_02205 [Companilactobacillus bobalius]
MNAHFMHKRRRQNPNLKAYISIVDNFGKDYL